MNLSKLREVIFVDDDQGKPNPWVGRVFPAIGPSGDLIVRFADTNVPGWQDAKAGQCPITLNSGRPAIHPEFAARGFDLYEDMCKGRIAGITASPKHWDYWLQLVKMRASGREPAPGSIPAERFYHPEVLRRREAASRGEGVNTMSAQDVAAFLGFGDQPRELVAEQSARLIFGDDDTATTILVPVVFPAPTVSDDQPADDDDQPSPPIATPSSSSPKSRKGQG